MAKILFVGAAQSLTATVIEAFADAHPSADIRLTTDRPHALKPGFTDRFEVLVGEPDDPFFMVEATAGVSHVYFGADVIRSNWVKAFVWAVSHYNRNIEQVVLSTANLNALDRRLCNLPVDYFELLEPLRRQHLAFQFVREIGFNTKTDLLAEIIDSQSQILRVGLQANTWPQLMDRLLTSRTSAWSGQIAN